ncbi:hypothetical protein V7114_06725 [Neobacillus niacini]
METYYCPDCKYEWKTLPTWECQPCPQCGEHLDVIETTDSK